MSFNNAFHAPSYTSPPVRATTPPEGFPFNDTTIPVEPVHSSAPFLTGLLIALLVIGGILGIALAIVVTWLRSRGRFMFIDGIVHDRDLVAQPWKEFKTQGNSLFLFQLLLIAASFVAIILCGGIGLLIASADIARHQFGALAVLGIIVGGLLFFAASIALGLVGAATNGLVVPIMYLRRIRIMEAWREARQKIIPGNVGTIILFFLMYFVLSIAAAIVLLLVGVLSCCVGLILLMLPYLGAVVSLPVMVFLWAYSLYFFQQFGPEYFLMPVELPPTPPAFPFEPAPPPPPPLP